MLIFNNNQEIQTPYQKLFGFALCKKLKFGAKKINTSIGLLHKLQRVLPVRSLVTRFKSFIKPHSDYGDIIFDQAYNIFFHENYNDA